MEVIPAVDIKGGRCVRLFRGEFNRETVYSPDPVGVARRWQSLGAPRLHVVDLDGAYQGSPANLPIIARLLQAVSLPVQVGGGIRSLGAIEELLRLGANRVVLGTVAVLEPELVAEACRRYGGERIVVSLDARRGRVRIKGWREGTGLRAAELAGRMAHLGVGRLIYTDISRDGTLTQPNFTALEELLRSSPLPILASGGISSLEHLRRLQAMGAEGAIVGKALYAGTLDPGQALKLFPGQRGG